MSEKKVTQEDVQRALTALGETVSKGLKGSGNTTLITGEASGVGPATQIHSMPNSFSSVKHHAGTATEDTSFSGEYSPNGTDVNYGMIAKSVLDAIMGGKMTVKEAQDFLEVVKGLPWERDGKKASEKDAKKEDGEKKDEKTEKSMDGDDDEDDKKVEKSFESNPAVDDGIEVSEFLKGIVVSISKALSSSEARIVDRVVAVLNQHTGKQEQFNKSLANAVSVMGEGIMATNSRVEQVEHAPARAPKSSLAGRTDGIVAKSFGGDEVNISRGEILKAMEGMVFQKSIDPKAVLKFESVGEISDQVMKQVIAHIQSGK